MRSRRATNHMIVAILVKERFSTTMRRYFPITERRRIIWVCQVEDWRIVLPRVRTTIPGDLFALRLYGKFLPILVFNLPPTLGYCCADKEQHGNMDNLSTGEIKLVLATNICKLNR